MGRDRHIIGTCFLFGTHRVLKKLLVEEAKRRGRSYSIFRTAIGVRGADRFGLGKCPEGSNREITYRDKLGTLEEGVAQ